MKGGSIQDSLHMVRTIVDKVKGNAALINLDQSQAFDRVDQFRASLSQLDSSPLCVPRCDGGSERGQVETLHLNSLDSPWFPLLPMLYVLALELFLRELKVNPVLRDLISPYSTEVARYTAYPDGVSVLVTRSAEVVEVSKEIGRHEVVTGSKINCEKSVGLRLGAWKNSALPCPFFWKDTPCKVLGVWFGPVLQLKKNWSEVPQPNCG